MLIWTYISPSDRTRTWDLCPGSSLHLCSISPSCLTHLAPKLPRDFPMNQNAGLRLCRSVAEAQVCSVFSLCAVFISVHILRYSVRLQRAAPGLRSKDSMCSGPMSSGTLWLHCPAIARRCSWDFRTTEPSSPDHDSARHLPISTGFIEA